MFGRVLKMFLNLLRNVRSGSLQVCKFSFTYQACIWPSSRPFCQKNSCSCCNCGINLVAVLEYTFFQLCSNAEQIIYVQKIKKELCRPPVVVPTTIKVALLFCLMCAIQIVHVLFLQLFDPDDIAFA